MEKPIQSVTRSYSRKIQLKQYEPIEFFSSRTYQWFDEEPTIKEVREVSAELYQECVTEVEDEINAIRPKVGGGLEEANMDLEFERAISKEK